MEKDKDINNKIKELWNQETTKAPNTTKEENWQRFAQEAFPSKQPIYKLVAKYAAAAIILIGAAGIGYYSYTNIPTTNNLHQQASYIVIENPSNKSKIVYLPDSTRIEMAPESKLSYTQNFTTRRDVKLNGEAFFNVTKDAQHPFTVNCNQSTTTVLGTSFTVKELYNGVNVQLYEGKVQMQLANKTEKWILAPGEQFTCINNRADIDTFITYKDFNKVPLKDVFAYLEEKRGYTIMASPAMLDKIVTLRIEKKDNLKNITTLIATLFNLKANINNTTQQIKFTNTN